VISQRVILNDCGSNIFKNNQFDAGSMLIHVHFLCSGCVGWSSVLRMQCCCFYEIDILV